MPVVEHFLIVFDHASQELIDVKQFGDPKAAVRAYEEAEAVHRDQDNLEIVLVGADSLETIHSTHGHYFTAQPRTPLASRFLAGV